VVLVEDEDADLFVLLLLEVACTFDMLAVGGSSMTGLAIGVAVGRTDMPHACSSTVGGLLWPIILVLVLVLDAVVVVQAADCCCCCCCPE
jgi:cell shape-determining protein MreD